jgi:hypothetical protein
LPDQQQIGVIGKQEAKIEGLKNLLRLISVQSALSRDTSGINLSLHVVSLLCEQWKNQGIRERPIVLMLALVDTLLAYIE